jgi:hypothetical protein
MVPLCCCRSVPHDLLPLRLQQLENVKLLKTAWCI